MLSVNVVGLSAISANGITKEKLFDSVASLGTAVGEDGFARLTEEQWGLLAELTPKEFQSSKCRLLGYNGLRSALQEADWTDQQIAESGFIFASTTSQIDEWENLLPFYRESEEKDPLGLKKIACGVANQSLGTPALDLAGQFHIDGPISLISSSCSASLQALVIALLWLRSGKVQRCIVGSTEIHSELTRIGFGALRLISKTACRPFDKNRNGINLGEGSAFLCLESAGLRNQRSKWGCLTGGGLSSDAYHATAPHPDGKGSFSAMKMAVQSAGLNSNQIDWVYSHGTGSIANDLAEARAINQLFNKCPVTSTKASHGHVLAASGALESVTGLMAMKKGVLLPTFNLKEVDPQIGINVVVEGRTHPVKHFLKNSLGFGGMNASVVFSKGEDPR